MAWLVLNNPEVLASVSEIVVFSKAYELLDTLLIIRYCYFEIAAFSSAKGVGNVFSSTLSG